MTELLAFNQVASGYGAARVLHGVDISVSANERVAIIGRNGVGKTTVINTFLGIARLNAGEVDSVERYSVRCVGSRQRAAASRSFCKADTSFQT